MGRERDTEKNNKMNCFWAKRLLMTLKYGVFCAISFYGAFKIHFLSYGLPRKIIKLRIMIAPMSIAWKIIKFWIWDCPVDCSSFYLTKNGEIKAPTPPDMVFAKTISPVIRSRF